MAKDLIILSLLVLITSSSTAGEMTVKLQCSGNIGDCLWQNEEEMELDSEINSRRVLWTTASATTTKKYISYEALKRDVVPCYKPGVSYYNCHSLPRSNDPYSRGCEIISDCRGGSP